MYVMRERQGLGPVQGAERLVIKYGLRYHRNGCCYKHACRLGQGGKGGQR